MATPEEKSNDEPSHARYQARRPVDKRVGEISWR
jgi:hypothetical protein